MMGDLHIAAAPWTLSTSTLRALDATMERALNVAGGDLVDGVWRASSAGKRLRPAVVLAAAGCPADPGAPALGAAAAIELMHWATLVHDDLIDGADTRHGEPTVNASRGLGSAVVAGDLLIGLSFGLAAPLGTGVTRCLSDTLTDLCRGEDEETHQRWRADVSEDEVIAVGAAKTGSLIAAAARIGGLCAGRRPVQVEALTQFGRAFGVSLQILDDLLDLVASADRLGKPVGADFCNGTVTLPGLAAMRISPELAALLRPSLTADEQATALRMLRQPAGLLHAVRCARQWSQTAAGHLRDAAGGDRALLALADWPERYVDVVLASKADPAYASLLSDRTVAAAS